MTFVPLMERSPYELVLSFLQTVCQWTCMFQSRTADFVGQFCRGSCNEPEPLCISRSYQHWWLPLGGGTNRGGNAFADIESCLRCPRSAKCSAHGLRDWWEITKLNYIVPGTRCTCALFAYISGCSYWSQSVWCSTTWCQQHAYIDWLKPFTLPLY